MGKTLVRFGINAPIRGMLVKDSCRVDRILQRYTGPRAHLFPIKLNESRQVVLHLECAAATLASHNE
jgi:hypothetical protein